MIDNLVSLLYSDGLESQKRYRQLGRTTALANACKNAREAFGADDVYLLCATESMARDVSKKFGINATSDIKWLRESKVKFIIDTSVFEVALRELYNRG